MNMNDAKESEITSANLKNDSPQMNKIDKEHTNDLASGERALTNLQNPYVDYNKIELARSNAKSVNSVKISAKTVDSARKFFYILKYKFF